VTGLVRKKVVIPVTPAKAGVQKLLNKLDSRLRGNDNVENGNDRKLGFQTFYGVVNSIKNGEVCTLSAAIRES